MWSLIIIAILFFIGVPALAKHKWMKYGTVNFITGAVKSGKTLFCVSLAINNCNGRRFRIKITNVFRKLFGKKPLELPLLYSNIPLNYKHYAQLDLEIIKRQKNIVPKSVVLIDEASLLADSMMYNDALLNEQVSLFIKLFGHSSHGGMMLINSQDLKDVHFSIKRSVSDIYYIENRIKLPFITIFKFKKFESVVDDQVSVSEDIYTRVIFNSNYNKYDCYCYSILTDANEVSKNQEKPANGLKQDSVLSFKKFKTIKNKE